MKKLRRSTRIEDVFKQAKAMSEAEVKANEYPAPVYDCDSVHIHFNYGFITQQYFEIFNPKYIKCCINKINGKMRLSYRQYLFK